METLMKVKIYRLISDYVCKNFRAKEKDIGKSIKELKKLVSDIDELYNHKETTSQIDYGEIYREVADIRNEIITDKKVCEL